MQKNYKHNFQPTYLDRKRTDQKMQRRELFSQRCDKFMEVFICQEIY